MCRNEKWNIFVVLILGDGSYVVIYVGGYLPLLGSRIGGALDILF